MPVESAGLDRQLLDHGGDCGIVQAQRDPQLNVTSRIVERAAEGRIVHAPRRPTGVGRGRSPSSRFHDGVSDRMTLRAADVTIAVTAIPHVVTTPEIAYLGVLRHL